MKKILSFVTAFSVAAMLTAGTGTGTVLAEEPDALMEEADTSTEEPDTSTEEPAEALEAFDYYEEGFIGGDSATSNGITINETDIKLYYLSDSVPEAVKTAMADCPKSFQLSVTGASSVSYTVTSGQSAVVSADGLITPYKETWYHFDCGGYGISTTDPNYPGGTFQYAYDEYTSGESTITVNADGTVFKVTVVVDDCAVLYAENVLDTYIAENITGKEFSDTELLYAICRFPASYDYGTHSGWRSMVVYGSGDCWASTSAIIAVCDKLGIEAWSRNGNRDPGAGGGHMNAMVELNGKYYELEAGYNEPAPRWYYVRERTDLFNYNEYDSETMSCTVHQYDGRALEGETLTIPETPGGYATYSVRKTGSLRAYDSENYKKIILPSTLEEIADFSLTAFSGLEILEIPAGVEIIGQGAFAGTKLNEGFTCSPDNPYFAVENGVLYDKEKTKLFSAPSVTTVEAPATLTEIGAYAFYYNKNLKTVDLSSSEVAAIQDYAFSDTAIESLLLPVTVESISDKAFYRATKPKYIYGTADSYAQSYAEEQGIEFRTGTPEDYPDVPENPDTPPTEHTHAFSQTWSADAQNHWHVCDCGAVTGVGAHSFVNGTCSVCGTVNPNYTTQQTGEWKEDGTGWWYRRADGSYPRNTWEQIGGNWYLFNASGYMMTGWQEVSGAWYYLNSDGSMAVNTTVDGYVIGADGVWKEGTGSTSTAGWKQDATGWWYKRADGSYPASAWEYIDGEWYLFNASGYMLTGWQKVGGTWYYMYGNGAMASNTVIDGYAIGASGAWVENGWKKDATGWWYQESDGTFPAACWRLIDAVWYRFNEAGYMQTGWIDDGGTWYYAEESGSLATGWKQIGSAWYYFYSSGVMAADTVIDGFRIGAAGEWIQ